MAYTMVIKVQYRDMLRRFNAKVDEDYKLDIDMKGLRAKIFSLFHFSPDADLTLTYIDEDGDQVTLVDDDELHDVVNQEMDFLMIDVVLNGAKGDKLSTSSGERCTPFRCPQRRPPTLPGLSSGSAAAIAELLLLKSLQDPLLEELSKIALNSVTKAASSSPLKMVRDPGSRSRSGDDSKDGSRPQELVKDDAATTTSKDENMQDVVPVVSMFGAPPPRPSPYKKSPPTFSASGQLQPPRPTPDEKNYKREEPLQIIHNIKPCTSSLISSHGFGFGGGFPTTTFSGCFKILVSQAQVFLLLHLMQNFSEAFNKGPFDRRSFSKGCIVHSKLCF